MSESHREQIEQLIRDESGCVDSDFSLDATLESLEMDSLDLIELQCQIEDSFDLSINDEYVSDTSTVSQVIDYVEGLVEAKLSATVKQ